MMVKDKINKVLVSEEGGQDITQVGIKSEVGVG